MTRAKTLIILGIFMLSLAVIAALELRMDEETASSSGQMVTGSISKEVVSPQDLSKPGATPDSPLLAGLPSTPSKSSQGVLVPLDSGTLRNNLEPNKGHFTSPPLQLPESSFESPRLPESSFENGKGQPARADSFALPKENFDTADNVEDAAPAPTKKPEEPKAPVTTVKVQAAPVQPVSPPKAPTQVQQSAPVKTSVASQQQPAAKTPSETKKTEEKKTSPSVATPEKEKAKSAPLVLTADAPDQLFGKQKAITKSQLILTKDVVFRIGAESPVKAKTILLPDPDRYVVDLQGDWGIELPKVPKNLLLKEIRVGRREGATRLVFELLRKPGSAEVKQIDPKTLEVRIR